MNNELMPVVSPPASCPAETVKISPENLEIANTYLSCQSLLETAEALGVSTDIVSETLGKREVRAYIDNIFLDYGFNNKFEMRKLIDTVIQKKLKEMDESDTGSSKDIIEIMALSHKMSMDILDRQIKLEEAQAKNQGNIKNQVNVQVNNASGGTRYDQLIEKLMSGK